MNKSEKLLRNLYVALKNHDVANNAFRSSPSDKTFSEYEKREHKLMQIEQLVKEYLDENNIDYKINVCEN